MNIGNNANKDFGRLRAGYNIIRAKSKTHGSLYIDGLLMEYNKPFALLQNFKMNKYSHITPKSRIKIIAMKI